MNSLPRGPFGAVVADPPWPFRNTKSRAAAENHYPSMSIDAIAALPVQSLAAEQAHLFLWVTAGHLEQGLHVMRAWGFEYKLPLVWVKSSGTVERRGRHVQSLQWGLGNWFRHAHELCLFGVRGMARARVHNLPTVFFAPRTEHSTKPNTIHEWAEDMSPPRRLELFARRERIGWTCWGEEIQRRVA